MDVVLALLNSRLDNRRKQLCETHDEMQKHLSTAQDLKYFYGNVEIEIAQLENAIEVLNKNVK